MTVIPDRRVRTVLRYLIPFGLIPVLTALGALVFDQRRHLIVSLGVAVLALGLFMTGFEKRNIGSRRMVLTAVLTAFAVFGRFIPVIKPVAAVIILAGMYLGAEAGFFTGALSVLISDIWFGQGPWTPFQMLGFGLIGLAAGYLSRSLIRHRVWLIVFGVFAGAAYSFIMDIWTVLWYSGGFDWRLYLAAIASAAPFTVSYAVSNALFLSVLAKPIGQKLARVKLKYGI